MAEGLTAMGAGGKYTETVSLCPTCARDAPSYYEERDGGMYLSLECPEHGRVTDRVENDAAFFRMMYERDDLRPERGHFVLPVTYRCNLKCRYCYTLSNSPVGHPPDRPASALAGYALKNGKSTIILGGEPTVRDDLFDIISAIKDGDGRHILSVGTNGQRLKDYGYVKGLKERGLDFVFLSLNDISYGMSREVYDNKLAALENCRKAGIAVWLQRTLEKLEQIDSIFEVVEKYQKTIFHITIHSVKPFGVLHPSREVFLSDMLRRLKKENDYETGRTPFHCDVDILGKKTRLVSWANDVGRIDPSDWGYLLSDDTLTTFYRGMRVDEVLLKAGAWRKGWK